MSPTELGGEDFGAKTTMMFVSFPSVVRYYYVRLCGEGAMFRHLRFTIFIIVTACTAPDGQPLITKPGCGLIGCGGMGPALEQSLSGGASSEAAPANTNYSPNYQAENTCSSDYSCGFGEQCVKKPYSSSGICMGTVNEYDMKTFQLPSTGSLGPNIGGQQCMFVTDCPIGFTCDATYKVCVKR